MADKPPPSRYSVVERGGRLVVIDRDTGQIPPTAAERMAEHDRRMGNEPLRPAPRAASAAPPPAKTIAASPLKTSGRVAAALAEQKRKQPWQDQPQRPRAAAKPPRAVSPPAAKATTGGGRETIVTGKWWDAKGPRTIELGPRGRQKLTGGFVTLFLIAAMAATMLLLISPVALFVAAFVLFRWGGAIIGSIGAGMVDKALAEKG